MSDLLKKVLYFGLGVAASTAEKVEEIVDEMVKKGELSESDKAKTMKDFMDKAQENAKIFRAQVEETVKEVLEKIPLYSKKEIDELKSRITVLEEKIAQSQEKDAFPSS